MTSVLKKGQKEDPVYHGSLSLILVPKEFVKQIIFRPIMQYVQDKQVFGSSQHRFMTGRSYLTHLISFHDSWPT